MRDVVGTEAVRKARDAASILSLLRGAAGRQLLILTLGAAAGLFARTAVGPLQETLSQDLALSDAQVALLQGPALALPIVALSVPLGLLIDRASRARLLLIAVALCVLGTAATASAPSFPVLLFARSLVGLAAPATGIIAYAMIADLFEAERRGRATTVVVLGQLIGSSGAFFVGGQLLGQLEGDEAWRMALIAMAALIAPAALVIVLLREPARGRSSEAASQPSAWSDLWRRRGVFVPLIVGMALVGLADGAAMVWTAPTLVRRFDLPPQEIGALVGGILLVAGVIGPLLGGWLSDVCHRRGGPRRTAGALGLLALLSLPCSLFAVMPSPATLGLSLLIFLALGPAISVMVTALTVIVMPAHLRGLCLSIKFATGTLLGIGAAPMIVGALSTRLGSAGGLPEALAMTCFATTLLGAAVLFWGRRNFPGPEFPGEGGDRAAA